MGLTAVRRIPQTVPFTTYEQTLSTFAIEGKIEFVFGTGPTWAAGLWSFASYTTAAASATQANLNLYASVSPPAGFKAAAPILDTINKRILIRLYT